MMFGSWGNPDHEESIRIIHPALDAGINFLDTADVYGAGESEEIVGKALSGGRRDTVVLATKLHVGHARTDPQHCLYLRPDPHQQRWFRCGGHAINDGSRRCAREAE